ncbi:MAG: 4Fe-4S binding protein [Desulfobacteraceae bacterium]|nr:4Fe-4S binding protein [Desulfobacteraceae bacterium]
MEKIFQKFNRPGSLSSLRRVVQILFCVIVISIGIKFYLFVSQLEIGLMPDFERPPGVEAFLPISALVSLKHMLFTGKINGIHPSALVIFLIVCLTALVVKKGFCSWICPLSLFSDILAKWHAIVFKKKLKLPFWVDLLLRSIKYILAVFFIWNIYYKMPINSIEQFILSPYNQFADIKMLKFFTDISNTALIVILVLCFLSFSIPYFWCRYLCPYGAVIGVLSFLSIGKIKRNSSHCIDCGKCEKNCPGLIKIRQKETIHSSECTACMTCVKNCPEKQSIGFFVFWGKMRIGQPTMALILILIFFGGISLAKVSDNWQNKITKPEYLRYVIQKDMPWGQNGQIDPKKMEKMMEIMKNIQAQRAQRTQPFEK